MKILVYKILFFFALFKVIYGQGWPQPNFRDPRTPGIVFENIPNRQAIRMDEELPRPIKLAIINYRGTGRPVIGGFTIGSNQNLQLSINKTGSQWEIYINTRQDYENPVQRRYEFQVVIENDKSVTEPGTILIVTNNLFDNDPSITYEGPCVAPELHANYNTDCKFEVYDPDGLTNNNFTLKIEGSNRESELFEFRDEIELNEYSKQYTLYVKKELRYEERAVYNFRTRVFDVVGNNGSVVTIVEVTDEPSLDPVWVKPFATARFPEKQAQSFQIEAIDGDTGINKPICYKVMFAQNQDYSRFISIDRTTGKINISPINRDVLKQEVFPFTAVAFKCDNETWAINGDAVIIVDDINDNYPEITATPSTIKFLEATYLTLPLDSFMIDDIDLGSHATYSVELTSISGVQIDYSQPFSVIPDNGYQLSNFTITVSDAKLLDYEDNDWRSFKLSILAIEKELSEHFRKKEFSIELINWNDELPIFNQSDYTIEVNETIPANQLLTTITATDRDVGDKVIHSIVGLTELSITDNGAISTRIDDTFDYERQTSVLIQIRATDTLQTYANEKLNTAFAQLIINILDVNDETPDIRMPKQSPSIVENSPGRTLVTDGILATDPDGTANLVFNIDWDESYATKSGQVADKKFYKNCFIIEADQTNRNKVIGKLIVNPDFEMDIDYEEYEVIYLSISVTDLNQEVNDDTAYGVLTIRVEDVNDNAPQFILNTLETERSVIEEALAGTLIGTIFAIDIDGPQFNKITYSIKPSQQTPPNLVEINPTNGAIIVKENAIIDCDNPKIYNLTYTINLSDGELETNGEINVRIIDINNKVPYFKPFENVIELFENITTGNYIQTVSTHDIDRDSPHNIVQHMINYIQFPNLMKYFEIDLLKGDLKVRLQNGVELDRDHGEAEHDIYINIEDNFQGNGRTNVNNSMVKLVLLDVNDNAPKMPSPNDFKLSIPENAAIGTKLEPTLYAPDIDDPETPNAWVGYKILSIKPGKETNESPPDADEIFEIITLDKKYGSIQVKQELKGFYGTWLVEIEAFDHGHEWHSQVQLRSSETYEITIDPFNFYAPVLLHPLNGQAYRLSFDDQQIGRPLKLADKTIIPSFNAEDPDGGIYGDITYEIANYGIGNDVDYFRMVKETAKQSRIHLEMPIEARFYRLNIRAIDGGGRYSDWASNVQFVFVNLTGEPVFENRIFNTDFTENTTGLEEYRIIPEASDPKNVGIDDETAKYDIYYFIDYSYRPDDALLFELDPVTRMLKLTTQLDRESIDMHEIRVVATNRKDGPENSKEPSMLIVEISVNDVNDNAPQFLSKSYATGITPNDYIGKDILIVEAFDPDLDDIVRYVILDETLTANGINLDNVLSTAFTIDLYSGVIKLNFAVSQSMKGFFEFKIQALDLVDHTDECDVKIFIIAESSRVTFVLLNTKETVERQKSYLIDTLSEFYGYKCNIDDILKAEINNVAQDNITNIRVHFINNNEAIEASEILARSNDIIFITKLKTALLDQSINLIDVPDGGYVENGINMQLIIQTFLIVVSVVFGGLLIALVITYYFRTKSLKRQLKALSTTDFGSDNSNLNRQKAPTTNVFSVEGSNPVLNNNQLASGVFDNISLTSNSSDDSEFVGIDNDPTFITTAKRDSTNIAVINGVHKRTSPIINGNSIKEQEEYDNPRDSDFGVYKF